MEPAHKLLMSGVLRLKVGDAPILLQRGMPVLTEDGQEACRVAAVVMDSRSQEVTHILLGPVPPTYDYRLIPINLVSQVHGGAVWLHAAAQEIAQLAVHQPNERV